MNSFTSDDNRFICPHCCKTFEKMNSLVGHFRTHNAHWLCDICGFTTDVYYQRLSHIQEKHGGKFPDVFPFSCVVYALIVVCEVEYGQAWKQVTNFFGRTSKFCVNVLVTYICILIN